MPEHIPPKRIRDDRAGAPMNVIVFVRDDSVPPVLQHHDFEFGVAVERLAVNKGLGGPDHCATITISVLRDADHSDLEVWEQVVVVFDPLEVLRRRAFREPEVTIDGAPDDDMVFTLVKNGGIVFLATSVQIRGGDDALYCPRIPEEPGSTSPRDQLL